MRILVISENACYPVGGAEQSLFSYVKSKVSSDDSLTVVSAEKKCDLLDYASLTPHVRIFELKFPHRSFLKYFPLLDALMSMFFRFRFFVNLVRENDLILSQNRWGPYIAMLLVLTNRFTKGNPGRMKLFIRDEKCLLIYRPYNRGIRRLMWYIRFVLELPFRTIHKFVVRKAFKHVEVIFNSNFMAELAQSQGLVAKHSEVSLPAVDPISFENCKDWLFEQPPNIQSLYRSRGKNVVMIGGEVVKGVETFIELSYELPELNFIIFSKHECAYRRERNLIFHPWSSVRGVPFLLAETVVVPSLWLEAFGRVVVEAKEFDCNIIVSSQGGLLEALGDYERGYVASNFEDYKSSLRNVIS